MLGRSTLSTGEEGTRIEELLLRFPAGNTGTESPSCSLSLSFPFCILLLVPFSDGAFACACMNHANASVREWLWGEDREKLCREKRWLTFENSEGKQREDKTKMRRNKGFQSEQRERRREMSGCIEFDRPERARRKERRGSLLWISGSKEIESHVHEHVERRRLQLARRRRQTFQNMQKCARPAGIRIFSCL